MVQYISWVATAATIIAALMTASNLGSRVTGFGFAVFLLGSIAWLATAAMTGQPALLWTNVVLSGLNLFGIWRWLGRQARIEDSAEKARAVSEVTPGEALFPASLLTRAPAIDREGQEVGSCVDAMIGSRSGRIAYIAISAGGVAGVGERLHKVEWKDARFDGAALKLTLASAAFAVTPELAQNDWPA